MKCSKIIKKKLNYYIGLKVLKRIDQFNNFSCTICRVNFHANSLIPHIVSAKHRTKYMQDYYMNYYTILFHCQLQSTKRNDLIVDLAYKIEEEEGRHFLPDIETAKIGFMKHVNEEEIEEKKVEMPKSEEKKVSGSKIFSQLLRSNQILKDLTPMVAAKAEKKRNESETVKTADKYNRFARFSANNSVSNPSSLTTNTSIANTNLEWDNRKSDDAIIGQSNSLLQNLKTWECSTKIDYYDQNEFQNNSVQDIHLLSSTIGCNNSNIIPPSKCSSLMNAPMQFKKAIDNEFNRIAMSKSLSNVGVDNYVDDRCICSNNLNNDIEFKCNADNKVVDDKLSNFVENKEKVAIKRSRFTNFPKKEDEHGSNSHDCQNSILFKDNNKSERSLKRSRFSDSLLNDEIKEKRDNYEKNVPVNNDKSQLHQFQTSSSSEHSQSLNHKVLLPIPDKTPLLRLPVNLLDSQKRAQESQNLIAESNYKSVRALLPSPISLLPSPDTCSPAHIRPLLPSPPGDNILNDKRFDVELNSTHNKLSLDQFTSSSVSSNDHIDVELKKKSNSNGLASSVTLPTPLHPISVNTACIENLNNAPQSLHHFMASKESTKNINDKISEHCADGSQDNARGAMISLLNVESNKIHSRYDMDVYNRLPSRSVARLNSAKLAPLLLNVRTVKPNTVRPFNTEFSDINSGRSQSQINYIPRTDRQFLTAKVIYNSDINNERYSTKSVGMAVNKSRISNLFSSDLFSKYIKKVNSTIGKSSLLGGAPEIISVVGEETEYSNFQCNQIAIKNGLGLKANKTGIDKRSLNLSKMSMDLQMTLEKYRSKKNCKFDD